MIPVILSAFSLRRRCAAIAVVTMLGMAHAAAVADGNPQTAVVPNRNAPVVATACVTTLYAYAEVVVNAMNRSTRQMHAIDVRYQYIDAGGRIIASCNNEFASDLASGDTDGYRYNVPGAVSSNAKQMRCIVTGATFAGKGWKRGQLRPEKLLPVASPSSKATVTS